MYKFYIIESYWQFFWNKNVVESFKKIKNKGTFYPLDMFPYPSNTGLHAGHPLGYFLSDFSNRFQRLKGLNLLYCMGWDAFGLPSEQHALKTCTHPAVNTKKNIFNFKKQILNLGLNFNWRCEINTTGKIYYKYTQLWFLYFFQKGLAYVKKLPVVWCNNLKTVLANEEVTKDGVSERGNYKVTFKYLNQWVFLIKKWSWNLINNMKLLRWPEKTKSMQYKWISPCRGAYLYTYTFDLLLKIFLKNLWQIPFLNSIFTTAFNYKKLTKNLKNNQCVNPLTRLKIHLKIDVGATEKLKIQWCFNKSFLFTSTNKFKNKLLPFTIINLNQFDLIQPFSN